MNTPRSFPAEGGCDCRHVRYRLESAPLFVHCCHCRWCQRESGAAFALNAMIEADRVTVLAGEVTVVDTPSASGRGQRIARCPLCLLALWSNYSGAGPRVHFVRVGTLDNPDLLPPDIHIFTASKQPWVLLPPGVPAMPEYYDRDRHWPAESLARRQALLDFGIVLFVVAGLAAIVIGGLRGWRVARSLAFRIAHLAAIAFVVAQAWLGAVCPLTTLEMWLRAQASGPTYDGGFIEHWVQRVLFYQAPSWVFTVAYSLFGLAVLAAWWYFPPQRRRR
jgi:hypothetical protein